MSNGERIIVKLDPNYNPTGKPMPSAMLEEMKADPDFAKLSQVEKDMVISTVENLIQEPEDLLEYGTLIQKIAQCALMKNFENNDGRLPYIALHVDEDYSFDGTKRIAEGCTVSAGATILHLIAMGKVAKKVSLQGLGNITSNALNAIFDGEVEGQFYDIFKFCIADIKAPITGKIFSLREMKNSCTQVAWNNDLFIVSSIPDDTRSAAIKWYKETTGKEPQYKTPEDIQEERDEQRANVNSFLSKWDL